MFVIGVPAQDWITCGEATFPRHMTSKDLFVYYGQKDVKARTLYDANGNPVMGEDKAVYFTFQGKHYLSKYNAKDRKYNAKDRMSVVVEPVGFWDFLDSKGLMVASNARFNHLIDYNDILGMQIKGYDTPKHLTLDTLQEKFTEAECLLAAVGVTGELTLHIDKKWPAD